MPRHGLRLLAPAYDLRCRLGTQSSDKPVYDVGPAEAKADDFDDVGNERVSMQHVTEMVTRLQIKPEAAKVCGTPICPIPCRYYFSRVHFVPYR